jgi:hypothetical protein
MCQSHHLVENKCEKVKDLFMNDNIFGSVRSEPRVMEIVENKSALVQDFGDVV